MFTKGTGGNAKKQLENLQQEVDDADDLNVAEKAARDKLRYKYMLLLDDTITLS